MPEGGEEEYDSVTGDWFGGKEGECAGTNSGGLLVVNVCLSLYAPTGLDPALDMSNTLISSARLTILFTAFHRRGCLWRGRDPQRQPLLPRLLYFLHLELFWSTRAAYHTHKPCTWQDQRSVVS